MALDEVCRPQGEGRPGVAAGQRRSCRQLRQQRLGRQRGNPEDDEGAPTDNGAHEDEDCGDPVADAQLHDHAGGDLLGLREVHGGVDSRHDQVADREDDPVGRVGVRDGQRHGEVPDHPDQEERPTDGSDGWSRVGEPRVPAVHPPHEQEQQDDPTDPTPPVVLAQRGCELGDGEDEDEVEEQLERRHRPGDRRGGVTTPTDRKSRHPASVDNRWTGLRGADHAGVDHTTEERDMKRPQG